MNDRLAGKVVLVAGASSGIGRAIALAAGHAGVRLALMARRAGHLEQVTGAIRDAGGTALAVCADATDENAARQAVDRTRQHYGRIDVLVNSVGLNIPDRALRRLSTQGWSSLLRTNLDSAYQLTQAVLPVFRHQRDGLLIHVASVGAKRADRSGAGYQAAKAGVAALAHATMLEEQENGVRVSVLYPGTTETPMLQRRPVPPTPDELARTLQPEDIADVCLTVMALPARAYVPELQILPSSS